MTTKKPIPLSILEEITNGFSVDARIGRGGYGDVYKGVYNGREIAVKLLHVDTVQGLDDQQFKNEVGNLLRVKHPNIVQLVGYCYETRKIYVEHNGANDFSERIYRVLCFEYLQGGGLDRHLCEPSLAPNWSTRYNIIKGVCEGLNFLHKCEPQILHLDLKPANILLDRSMEPKVADLGLSRLFTQSHTHVTERIIGTQKYMPPEFTTQGMISPKNDVFSLGAVMIEIMTGSSGYSSYIEMDDVALFLQQVVTKWSTMIEATNQYRSEEIHQVKMCIELAIRCVDPERENRPTVAHILDALNKTESHIPKRQLADVPPCSTVGLKSTSRMFKKIPAKKKKRLKMMITESDNIRNKHQHFNCMPGDRFNTTMQQSPDRETSSDVEPTLIIGRDEEKHKILSILSEKTEEMAILPIYGIGGIGKTTLAQLVFNDTQFQDYSRVWVYVSQKFDLKKIGNSIISQLTNSISHIAEMQMLHNRLGELFSGKRTLIVLDDLWEEKQHELDKLKVMLMPRRGSKVVVVTTRDEAIARKISKTVMPYKLEVLTDDMCWSIIKQKSFFEDQVDKKQLEQTGRDIAIKCGGVALAAQSLGYMLRDMTYDQWESVRDSYIWNLSTMEDPSLRNHEVLVSLLLSYSHMHEFLQLCFPYCAIFPKGHNIVKYDLIYQWMALGLTGPSSTFDSIQLCEKYITQLLGMSFLQHSNTHSSDRWHDKDAILFTMHDLVHDLARAILVDQVCDEGNASGNRCRYALLTDCSKSLQLSVASPANIRALHFLGCGKLELQGHAFSPAECLHVLDLSGCFIRKSPDSIGQLKQLRYLRAPQIQERMIPDCITALSELNYLNLRGSAYISALPESIGDMKSLMHLDLPGCCGIRELPVSFTELKQLVHLDLSHCHVSTSEEFGGFTKLQYLNLSVKVSVVEEHRRGLLQFIGNLKKLMYLNLSGCMNGMCPSENQIGRLLDSISTLSNLRHLDLSTNFLLSSIPESMGNLRKLHTLDLLSCNLNKLPDSMVNMVSLKVLNVDRHVILDESVLSLLNIASLPHFVVHASGHKSSSTIIRLQPTNPVELTIDRLENVKTVEEAQSIKLVEKGKIEVLGFQWTLDAGRILDDKEVLGKLVPPSSVKELNIGGYRSVSFPDWLMGIRLYLPNLLQIDLCDFPNCSSLPPLGQLPNLKLLSLFCMGGLEEWNTAYTCNEDSANEPMFPKLEELTITKCDKLRIKPCLPSAIGLFIEDSDVLLSSGGESSSHSSASSSSPVTELAVCISKLPLHEWRLLRQLPALSGLTIGFCRDLTTSPDTIQHLSSLQSLTLENNYHTELPSWVVELTSLLELTLSQCRNMTSLPKWLGKLASLKKLRINYCKGIMSLPDSIQQLTNLEHLLIDGCPTLKEWCESQENKMKLAHIREVLVDKIQSSAYMGMHEEQQLSWLVIFLAKHN